MPDEEIVALFLAGDESALRECREKYGGYLSKIAYNILGDISDSEEAVRPRDKPRRLKSISYKACQALGDRHSPH